MSHPLPNAESSAAHPTGIAVSLVRTAADLPRVLDAVEAAMGRRGYPVRDHFGVRLALEEAVVNALKHGHGGNPTLAARVRWRVTAGEVLAEVQDEGPGFDPEGVADPCDPANVGRPCGRGLLLIRHYTTWSRYDRGGTRLTLCRKRSPA